MTKYRRIRGAEVIIKTNRALLLAVLQAKWAANDYDPTDPIQKPIGTLLKKLNDSEFGNYRFKYLGR